MASKPLEDNKSNLKSDSIQVLVIQLEIEYQKAKKNVKVEKKRLDRLTSQLQFNKQQIEFYTHEYQKALECIKDCN